MARDIVDELTDSYLGYAFSVITGRAIPDSTSGLKAVHKRILWSMYINNNRSTDKFKKSANVVGDVVGGYHPHSNDAIYESVVKLTQKFFMRYPLIEGQGNFGSIDGDPAAAMRYTEVKMSKFGEMLLRDIDKNTIDFKPNYDATKQEPCMIPTPLPNLLLNGSIGIAVGVSTSIPPHNIKEVAAALVHLIDNPEAEDLMDFIKAPDMPTGGCISNLEGLREGYNTGKGSFIIRARHKFEEDKIVFTEVPYQVIKSDLVKQISDNIKAGNIDAYSVRDESGRNGIRVVVRPKAQKEIVLNQIHQNTNTQVNYRIYLFALDARRGEPRLFTLKGLLEEFLWFREEILLRKTYYEIDNIRKRMHISIGYLVALDNIDIIIEKIKDSHDTDEAKRFLLSKEWNCNSMKDYLSSLGIDSDGKHKFSDEQIKAILELKLSNLVKMERGKIEKELDNLRDKLLYSNKILSDKEERKLIIKNDLLDLAKRFDNGRMSEIDFSYTGKKLEKDLILKENIVIMLGNDGYVRRINEELYKTQRRGGTGRGTTGEGENKVIFANTHDKILLFSNKGKVYSLNSYEIPTGQHNTKGRALVNLIDLENDEKINNIIVVKEENDSLIFVSSNGKVRRNDRSQFENIRNNGKKYMEDGENLVAVLPCKDSDFLFLATECGMAVRTEVANFRVFNSRNSDGVIGCKLEEKDRVVSAFIASNPEDLILTVSENGMGKITPLKDYRLTNRGAKGVINMKNKSPVMKSIIVTGGTDIIVLTQKGNSIRLNMKEIRVSSRNTVGVKLCKIANDKIADVISVSE
jgi:DNA gyrase subunit A